ncbi:MAG: hypothetical protein OXT09_27690 [Myxococcales bacterium]|nr:hypothetical protein [Myxococcales bacterium]
MATCSKCGSSRVEPDGTCRACQEARIEAADVRQAELKIDPRRLDEAPEPDAMPEPGAWGRGSDAPPERASGGVTPLPRRASRRSPAPAATDRNAALKLEPEDDNGTTERASIEDAEVVPLHAAQSEGADTATAERPTPPTPRPPPVLASVALRRDLAPAAPAPATLRVSAALLGLIGMLACVAISGVDGLGLVLAGAFAAIAVVGLSPMSYPSRAAAVVTLTGGALTLVTWQSMERLQTIEPIVLLVGVLVLSSALLFRAWHRASLLARAMTLLGMASCMGWLWMARSLATLTILDTQWQAWLPPVLQVPLALILMLSLLAFMDSRSTGGCGMWASLLLLWYVTLQWSQLLALYWPRGTPAFDITAVAPELASAQLAQPLLASLLAVGLAQLLAVASAAEH